MRSPLKLTGSPSWDFLHLFLRSFWETGEISHSLTLVSHRSHSCLGEVDETLLRSLFQFSFPLGKYHEEQVSILLLPDSHNRITLLHALLLNVTKIVSFMTKKTLICDNKPVWFEWINNHNKSWLWHCLSPVQTEIIHLKKNIRMLTHVKLNSMIRDIMHWQNLQFPVNTWTQFLRVFRVCALCSVVC